MARIWLRRARKIQPQHSLARICNPCLLLGCNPCLLLNHNPFRKLWHRLQIGASGVTQSLRLSVPQSLRLFVSQSLSLSFLLFIFRRRNPVKIPNDFPGSDSQLRNKFLCPFHFFPAYIKKSVIAFFNAENRNVSFTANA